MNFKEFRNALNMPANDLVFVGLGNESRGDDAAGLLFLRRLKNRMEFHHSNFVEAGTNPENHLEKILQPQPKLVVFIDAVPWGGAPGEMSWIDSENISSAQFSTHAFSITMVEQYLKAQQPLQVRFFGIQPQTMKVNGEMSDAIKRGMELFFKG